MKPQQLKDLLDKYTRGECTPEEVQYIDQWYNNITETSDEETMDVQQVLTNRSSLEATLWSKLKPTDTNIVKRAAENNFLRYLKVAAALFIPALIGAGAYLFSSERDMQTQNVATNIPQTSGQTRQKQLANPTTYEKKILLADGSEVSLRPNSEIRVGKNFEGNLREVYLTGEAFFKVKRDESRPFVVYTNEVVTRVLGTSFNIKAYQNDKEITVAVKTGKVSVYTQGKEKKAEPIHEVILTPNQKVVYNRDDESVTKQLVEKPEIILPEGTSLKMVYDGVPVTEIFEALEKNYGVEIAYDEEILSGCMLTTSMTDEGLYQRIEVICKAINAEYTISEAVIRIKSRGCL
jgi:ferric-dicitrate binding protein FerR (iron transport regulator)